MWSIVWKFWCNNWPDLLLVLVGTSAFFTYWLQGRRKISEAASLIVMQVEDLQKRMREMKTYISEGQLNDTAFYESQVLFKTDYWDANKHYFSRKMDSFSLSIFDEYYNCASEVKEQQELMKNLQKNFFFMKQQTLMQLEANSIIQTLNLCNHIPEDLENVIEILMTTVEGSIPNDQKTFVESILKQVSKANSNIDYGLFWNLYNKDKQTIFTAAANQDAFTRYNPAQISISIEKALKQFDSIPIIGCKGYDKLKKLAKRRI